MPVVEIQMANPFSIDSLLSPKPEGAKIGLAVECETGISRRGSLNDKERNIGISFFQGTNAFSQVFAKQISHVPSNVLVPEYLFNSGKKWKQEKRQSSGRKSILNSETTECLEEVSCLTLESIKLVRMNKKMYCTSF